ncbi:neurogenic locus notch homolog protein 1-like [Physella acuta]|uniref:neurogenic locus notch homolog protein 1-like n=1 Tax=Physella acuta TaxID=109671 RepID=UPI0027DCE675|nr:neurogenic locus notch homolog protein 1-like [Physella acuta]XP_059170896.1 neurogenic locus notch homolog protein 1-like [Physella acuta]
MLKLTLQTTLILCLTLTLQAYTVDRDATNDVVDPQTFDAILAQTGTVGETQVYEPLPSEWHCKNREHIRCRDISYCPEALSCECEPGWSGLFCTEPCNLPCVNGVCLVYAGRSYCNCQQPWSGQFCQYLSTGRSN